MNIKKALLKLSNFLLALFILFTVLPVKLNYSSITIISLTTLSVISLISKKFKKLNQQGYFIFFISIPLAVYILGLINTSNLDYGISFIEKNLSFLAFPVIFFCLGKSINKEILYKVFLLGLFVTNIYLIYLFFYYFNFGLKFYKIVTLDIYHSTYLGMYNLVAYWTCFCFFIKKTKKVYLFIGVFFLICAILASARIIYILSILSLIASFLFVIKSKIKRIIAILLTSFFSLTILLTTPSFKQKFKQILELEKIGFDKNNYRSISSRFGKIQAASSVLKENIWFGTGTGDLIDELVEEYKSMNFVMGYKYRYNPHNQYLDSLTRNGILGGGLSLMAIFILPLYLAIRKKSILLLTFTITVGFVCLTESVLDVHKGITFYTFFMTLIISDTVLDKKKNLLN